MDSIGHVDTIVMQPLAAGRSQYLYIGIPKKERDFEDLGWNPDYSGQNDM